MKQSYRLSAKKLGFILIAISIVLSLIFLSSTRELTKAADIECREVCGPEMEISCPHARSIPLQSYAGFSTAFILAGFGIFMILSGRKYQEEITEKEKELEKIIATLKGDEKKISNIIKDGGGAMFQSELVEKTGLSKVKVTRILDKLEGKGLIERRRRGMSNLVLFKYEKS